MDGFPRHHPPQHVGGAFWHPSSSSPSPPAAYHPPPPPPHLSQNLAFPPPPPSYHHQPTYPNQMPIAPPPPHQIPQPWFHPPQQPSQPAMAVPPLSAPLPNYPQTYHPQPGLPPPYPPPQHHYPPHPHPMASPSPAYPLPSAQTWGNPSWSHHQLWEYPDQNIQCGSEEDWAAKARAWAATDSVTEIHHARPQFTSFGRMDEQAHAYNGYLPKVGALAADNQPQLPPHSNGRALCNEDEPASREISQLSSPPRNYFSSSFIYEQEVPYTYSSSQGNRETVDHREMPQEHIYPRFTAPVQLSSVEEPRLFPGNQLAKPPSDSSDQPLDFHPRSTFASDQHNQFSYSLASSAANEGVMDQNLTMVPVHTWSSATVPVVSFPTIPLAPSGTLFDSSFASQPTLTVHPAPVFGGVATPSFQPPVSPIRAPFGIGVGTSLHSVEFSADGNSSFNLPERPKKAAVPSWLREEIIKKKSAIATSNLRHPETVEMEDADTPCKNTDQTDKKSIDTRRSTEDDDDDEDEVEAARSAAINQEIKRVLTEVLLKVTDELFDEIATKVLDEDEPTTDVVEITSLGNFKSALPLSTPTPKTSSKVLVPMRTASKSVNDAIENSSHNSAGGDLLGLANYGSDVSDDDYDVGNQGDAYRKLDTTVSRHLQAPARSHEHTSDDSEVGKKLLNADDNNDAQKEKMIFLPDLSERKRVGKFHANVPGVSELSEKTSSISTDTAGEFLQDGVKYLKSSGIVSTDGGRRHEPVSGDKTTSKECQDGEVNILSSSTSRKLEKSLNSKEVAVGSHNKDKEISKHAEKQKEKMDNCSKINEWDGDNNAKQGAIERETHSKSSSRSEGINDGRKEKLKDKGEYNNGYEKRSEGKRGKKEDYKRPGKEDRSELARETLKRQVSSRSPASIRRYAKEYSASCRGSASSEESSDTSRKRKLKSRETSLSTSPRSTKRQASRSPHSKHSHSRHPPYSTAARRIRRSGSHSPDAHRRPPKH